MNRSVLLLAALSLPAVVSTSMTFAADAVGSAFYGDPPDATHPWAIHDRNRPQPPIVVPGTSSTQDEPGKAPSDAVVLFDGTAATLANWVSDKKPGEPTKWEVVDGALQCVPGAGYTRTKEEFGDCQLHVEWTAPTKVEGNGQGRGNSGVFLMGAVEVQVLDNYNNPTYADGTAGCVYGVSPPQVNPLRAPGQWQSYDIIFRRPIFDKDGKELDPGSLTVFINGVLVQEHTALEGGGGHKGRSKPKAFAEKGPLKLQDHGNPVRYRNIWYRPLPKRALEGGVIGILTEEAASAQKKATAASLRGLTAKLEGNAKLLGLLEVLTYEQDAETVAESSKLADAFVAEVKAVPADKIESKKGEVLGVHNALQYLAKFKLIPDTFAAKEPLAQLVKEREWDKKK